MKKYKTLERFNELTIRCVICQELCIIDWFDYVWGEELYRCHFGCAKWIADIAKEIADAPLIE